MPKPNKIVKKAAPKKPVAKKAVKPVAKPVAKPAKKAVAKTPVKVAAKPATHINEKHKEIPMAKQKKQEEKAVEQTPKANSKKTRTFKRS